MSTLFSLMSRYASYLSLLLNAYPLIFTFKTHCLEYNRNRGNMIERDRGNGGKRYYLKRLGKKGTMRREDKEAEDRA